MNTPMARLSNRPHRLLSAIELLESRRLMSGTWNTVDSIPVSSGIDGVAAMTSDSAGNIYAVGSYNAANVPNGAVLREKPSGSSSFVDVPVSFPSGGYADLSSVAVDANGNVFVVADNFGSNPLVLERPAGQSAFAPVSVALPSGANSFLQLAPQPFATDTAGTTYLVGSCNIATGTTGHGPNTKTLYTSTGVLWEMAAGQSSFKPVYNAAGFSPIAVTCISTGASAGMYIIDDASWQIEKSTNGGTAWTQIDNFNYDPNAPRESVATALGGDSSGNLFVAGEGQQKVITGYKTVKVNGKLVQQAVYGFNDHLITRQSSNGGATWTTADDFQLTQITGNSSWAYGLADLGGTVYVAADCTDSAGIDHGIIRTNAGGSWQTADDYVTANNDYYDAVTIDPTTGIAYGGAGSSWTIRSSAASAPNSSASAVGSKAFSSTLITTSSATSSNTGASWLQTPDDPRLPQLA